jgi:hypothetical protein
MATMVPTRSAFLGTGSALVAVVAATPADLARAAQAADPADLQTLNAAIELERAGIKAYDDAAATGLLSAPVLAVALGFRSDHVAHRDALIGAVTAAGGVPSEAVAHIPYPTLATQTDILKFAMTVEEKAASTYLSVIADFTNRKLAEVAASILGVETTHVATLASALGAGRPYPSSFVS